MGSPQRYQPPRGHRDLPPQTSKITPCTSKNTPFFKEKEDVRNPLRLHNAQHFYPTAHCKTTPPPRHGAHQPHGTLQNHIYPTARCKTTSTPRHLAYLPHGTLSLQFHRFMSSVSSFISSVSSSQAVSWPRRRRHHGLVFCHLISSAVAFLCLALRSNRVFKTALLPLVIRTTVRKPLRQPLQKLLNIHLHPANLLLSFSLFASLQTPDFSGSSGSLS